MEGLLFWYFSSHIESESMKVSLTRSPYLIQIRLSFADAFQYNYQTHQCIQISSVSNLPD